MLAFISLIGNDGEPLDPALIDHLEGTAPAMLPFVPDQAIHWLAPSAMICVIGREAFAEQAGMGAHWHERADGGLTAFSGHCWPAGARWPKGATPWAVQLDIWLGKRDPTLARDGLFGHFDLIGIDAHGRGMIVPDFLSCGPLYTAHAAGCGVVSNRAGRAALAVTPEGMKPIRSPMGAGWLVFNALLFDDETGYVAVDHLPHGATVRIDPDRGLHIERGARSALESRQRDDLPSTYAELVPLMARTSARTFVLSAACRSIRSSSGSVAARIRVCWQPARWRPVCKTASG